MGNDAHAHLLVNHFPIVAAFLSVPMLVFALLLRKERGLLLASVFLLVVTAASGWASLTTGEDAMDYINDKQDAGAAWTDDVDDAAITEHEERAENSMYFAVPTALLGLVVLVLAHRRAPDNPLPRFFCSRMSPMSRTATEMMVIESRMVQPVARINMGYSEPVSSFET